MTSPDECGTSALAGPSQCVLSKELWACAAAELDCLSVYLVRSDRALYLSDVSSGMSRLAHAVLGTTQLILVGGSKALGPCSTWDRRPRSAGSTFWIDETRPLASQLADAARFANRSPTIVASPSGRGVGAVVCAAIVAAREGLSSIMALQEVKRRRGPLGVELDDIDELDAFCRELLLAEFGMRLGLPSSPSSKAAPSPKVAPSPHEEAQSVSLKLRGASPTAEEVFSTPDVKAATIHSVVRSPVKSKRGARPGREESPARSPGESTRRKKWSSQRASTSPELDGWKLE